jgi:hypothetical protein
MFLNSLGWSPTPNRALPLDYPLSFYVSKIEDEIFIYNMNSRRKKVRVGFYKPQHCPEFAKIM